MRFIVVALMASCASAWLAGQTVVQQAVSEPRTDPVREAMRTAVFVIGDSTVKNQGPGEGWGDYLAPFLDEARVQVVNWAADGRSSGSFHAHAVRMASDTVKIPHSSIHSSSLEKPA